jgi:glutaredoxin 3
MTANIELFTTTYCPYCLRAKALLDKKGVPYQLIDLSNDDEGRDRLVQRTNGKRTVPQIFINDKHIGGCDDLYALDKSGALDRLLGA